MVKRQIPLVQHLRGMVKGTRDWEWSAKLGMGAETELMEDTEKSCDS
jgi:hypothetical protein